MLELALAVGRSFDEVAELEPVELATLVDVLEERARRG